MPTGVNTSMERPAAYATAQQLPSSTRRVDGGSSVHVPFAAHGARPRQHCLSRRARVYALAGAPARPQTPASSYPRSPSSQEPDAMTEKPIAVAYPGRDGAHSAAACRRLFPGGAELRPLPSFTAVAQATAGGEVDF